MITQKDYTRKFNTLEAKVKLLEQLKKHEQGNENSPTIGALAKEWKCHKRTILTNKAKFKNEGLL